jgi:hypothetical protein
MDRPTVSDRAPPPRSRRALWAGAGAAALVAVAIVAGAARGGRSSAPPAPPLAVAPPAPAPAAAAPPVPVASAPAAPAPVATYVVDLRVSPSRAAIDLDGEPAGTGSLHRTLPADGRRHVLRATAHGFKDGELAFQDQPPPPTLRLSPASAHHAAAPGRAPAAVPDDSVLLERR